MLRTLIKAGDSLESQIIENRRYLYLLSINAKEIDQFDDYI